MSILSKTLKTIEFGTCWYHRSLSFCRYVRENGQYQLVFNRSKAWKLLAVNNKEIKLEVRRPTDSNIMYKWRDSNNGLDLLMLFRLCLSISWHFNSLKHWIELNLFCTSLLAMWSQIIKIDPLLNNCLYGSNASLKELTFNF